MKTKKSFIVCVKGLNAWCAQKHYNHDHLYEFKDGKYYDWIKEKYFFYGNYIWIEFDLIKIKTNLFYTAYQLQIEIHVRKDIVIELKKEFDNWSKNWFNNKKWSSKNENYLRPNPISLGKWSDIELNDYNDYMISAIFDNKLRLHAVMMIEFAQIKTLFEMNENELIEWLIQNKVIELVK